ncbi:MAG: cobalamin biosynthesis protein [Eubacterium sp.]|nr:cobalamin biosynthesis protein [Eubacterium sp.]
MQDKNALLFIGACGIAVRAVAPYISDKLHDVPVLVMDEMGSYVIPILSGHMGGANKLALCLAKEMGAEPIITTATDIHGKFAVDLFAKKNHLFIENKNGIAAVSAKVLAGEEITISMEPRYEKDSKKRGSGVVEESRLTDRDCPPQGVRLVSYPPKELVDVIVTSGGDDFGAAVLLRPREYVIGIGCKKGKSAEEIEDLLIRQMKEAGISTEQVFVLASVSNKRNEQGIVAWCRKEGLPFLTYSAEELQKVEGDFAHSDFVESKVGVDNVCERAALKACGEDGKLILGKYAENGMTIAIAKRGWTPDWKGWD